MKKILSFILAALMTASCAAYVAADDAAVEETTSNAAQDYAISFLANYGIFKGYNAEDTGAEDLIQRYQMALFVSRISTGWTDDDKWEDGTANNATFKDIEEGAAANYLGAISYANQNGIIEGYTANTFAPYDNITYRDALTMVVRTLGYKGLTYPWGYIEKAVDLELTEGIGSDVAYTDNLTRGEVATIIYNAMFAETAKGGTLAKSIFDVDFAWQNIMVVSTEKYTTIYNDDGKGVYAEPGYVGFKTIDDKTAALGDKLYYIAVEDLGLENAHDDERAVGSVFTALFEEGDKGYVTLIDADANTPKVATVFNNGVTDNNGDPYETMPIRAYLADNDYATVKEYTDGYVNYSYADLKVYGYKYNGAYDVDGNATNVGIDYATGDILKWNVCDTATHGKDGHVCGWTVEWYYNETLDRYYQRVVLDSKNGDVANKLSDDLVGTTTEGEQVYINWMSEKEFNAWYAEAVKELKGSYCYVTLLDGSVSALNNGEDAYAKLHLFDIDHDDVAEVANYKSYRIGRFYTKTDASHKCYVNDKYTDADGVDHSAGVAMPYYYITDLDGTNADWVFVDKDHEMHNDTRTKGFGWVTVDESVTGFANEDGTYNDGVVLYNWNKTSGEIEVVKYITSTPTDDEDSYIVTGILQAYNTDKQTVTISGVTYPISYNNLAGDKYTMYTNTAAEKLASRILLADTFDDQYMQYVEAVVCDGYVVYSKLVGNTNNFIVVLGYAGVTSDGYIAVYGYSTADLTLRVFKINSYNGWKFGDYRYSPENAANDDAFEYGTLYQIKSYDSETESYGVYTENVSSVLASATPVSISFEKGYRVVQEMTVDKYGAWTEKKDEKTGKVVDPSVTKMDTADKYIIVDDANNPVTSKIFVYNGVVSSDGNYAVTGYQVNVNNAKIIVVYAMEHQANGFDTNAYEVGYVLYEKGNGKVLNAGYDDAQDVVEDWYLLGATTTEVRALNLLTGSYINTLKTPNVDLVNGHIYKTVGGMIIADVTDDITYECNGSLHAFIDKISGAYHSTDLDYADYIVSDFTDLTKGNDTDAYLAWALGLYDLYNADGTKATTYDASLLTAVDNKIADALIHNDRLYYIVDDDQANVDIYGHGPISVEKLDKLADNTYYFGWIVYDVATKKTVVYVWEEAIIVEGTTDKVIDGAKGDEGKVLYTWDYSANIEGEATLEADWAGTYKTYTVGNKTVNASATIDEVALYFDVNKLYEHDDIAMAGYVFGILDDHDESYFGFNDSEIKVVTDLQSDGTYKTTKWFVAKNMNKYTWNCNDKCGMVAQISVSGLNITLNDKNPVAWVRFVINGDYGHNGVTEGNNIEVCVKLSWNSEKGIVEVSYDGDVVAANALTINGVADNGEKGCLDTALQSITLSLIQ